MNTPERKAPTPSSPLLSVAAGKKWVSALGLVMVVLGFLCGTHREQLNTLLSIPFTNRLCDAVTLIGGLLGSLGKGLADRRATRTDLG